MATSKKTSNTTSSRPADKKRSVAAKSGGSASKKLAIRAGKPAARKKAPGKGPAKAPVKAKKPAKAPAKKPAVKAVPKKAVPVKTASKPPAKAKIVAKAPAKAPVKAATKAPVKAAATVTAKPQPPAKTPIKAPIKPAAKAPVVPAKPAKPFSAKRLGDFACGDYVVYPTHGVGLIEAIEEQTIAGFTLRLYVIRFEKEKMTLRVPVNKVAEAGLRKLSSRSQIDAALTTLRGRSRVSRAMWSRRAQEYEAKINSGDPVAIAEVVRDLHRNAGQPDQSYSERQIYEAALERLARELAAVEKIETEAATAKLEQVLGKAA
ncbi:MAG: hypothetical protein RL477_422 [Pseudomonadota bacterium]|jgi:CarD family transcriptional regulator